MKFVFFSLVSYTLNLLLVLVLVSESFFWVLLFSTLALVKFHKFRDLASTGKNSRSRIYATAKCHLHLYSTMQLPTTGLVDLELLKVI